MALVFAAIVPHPPLSISSIGKEHADQFTATNNALSEMARELQSIKPDAVIVISPHGSNVPEVVCLNVHSPYVTDFTAFGDLLTKTSWQNTPQLLTERLRHAAKINNVSLVSCTEDNLDYGTSIPLMTLLRDLTETPILPILTGSLSIVDHYGVGNALHDALLSVPLRIGVITSVDLSHRVTNESPQGLSPLGVSYDELIQDIVGSGKLKRILDVTDEMDTEAQSCASRPIALMAGLLGDIHFTPQVYSYEQRFGTGYMVAQLKFS